MTRYDWQKIKEDYIHAPDVVSRPTLERLAEKHGCSPSYLREKAALENWKIEAERYLQTVANKRQEQKSTALAGDLAEWDAQCFDTIKARLPLPESKTAYLYETNYSHANYLLIYHLVFIPKQRKRVLVDMVATKTRQIFLELALGKGWDILVLEIAPDQVDLFIAVKPTDTPHWIANAFKRRSSNYLRKEFPHLLKTSSLWDRSYLVGTVGDISSKAVTKYREDRHHAIKRFELGLGDQFSVTKYSD